MTDRFLKDPDATLDYQVDWTAWLETGETITVSTWTVDPGITVGTGGQAPSHTGTAATIWLSGGTVGTVYNATNEITTSDGRIDDRTIRITVIQR